MKFLISLDQKAAIAAGVDCPNSTTTIDIDPAQIPETIRATIAKHYDPASGRVGGAAANVVIIPPASPDQIIAAWQAAVQAAEERRQERLAEYRSALTQWAAKPIDQRVARNWGLNRAPYYAVDAPRPAVFGCDGDTDALALYHAAANGEAKQDAEAEAARLNAELEANEARRAEAAEVAKKEMEAKQERIRAARKAWLVAHCTPERLAQYKAGHLSSTWLDEQMEEAAWAEFGVPAAANCDGLELTDIDTVPPEVWDEWAAIAARLPKGHSVEFEKGVPESSEYGDGEEDDEVMYFAYVRLDLDRIELPRIARRFAL